MHVNLYMGTANRPVFLYSPISSELSKFFRNRCKFECFFILDRFGPHKNFYSFAEVRFGIIIDKLDNIFGLPHSHQNF